MTIETEVAALTVATTALLSTVNVKKDTLDAYIASTSASATLATTKAADATTQAGLASGSAASSATSAGSSSASAISAAASAAAAAATAGFNPATKANLDSPTFTGTVNGITKNMVGLGNVDNTADSTKPVSTAQAAADALKIDTAAKDASGGVPGLTLFKLNLRNAANTFTNFFTSASTAARTWTLPDRSGTLADSTDLALKANLTSPNFAGTVTGITKAMVGLTSADDTADTAKPVSTAQATAIGTSTATNTTAAAVKATPIDADVFPFTDSAASFGLKKLTWANIKTTLLAFFAPSFLPVGTVFHTAMNAAPSGSIKANGALISRTTYAALFAELVKSGTATLSIATPGVATWTAHGRAANDPVKFKTTGALPTGLVSNTVYYVVGASITANTFTVSTVPGGAAIATSGTQSGVHTAIHAPWGDGDGATTFAIPDARTFIRGWDDGRGLDSNRAFGSDQLDDYKSHTHNANHTIATAGASGGAVNTVTGVSATGASGGTETRPHNVSLLACIKY
jgi:hypothetical protein